MHPVAVWAPKDFDLSTEQSTQTSLKQIPRFLQPVHQPQMRLPSISSSWFLFPGGPQVDQIASLMMFSGYNGHNPMPSSPIEPFQLPNPPTYLRTHHSAQNMYTTVDENGSTPPPVDIVFRNPWEKPSYAVPWASDGVDPLPDGMHLHEQSEHQESPGLSQTDNLQPLWIYPQDVEPQPALGFYQYEAHQPIRSQHLTHDSLPSPAGHDPLSITTWEEQAPTDIQAPATPRSHSPPDVKQIEDAGKVVLDSTTDLKHTLGGSYIHALCGKGFETRSKVKKHHWGKKHNDLATTTGCWARYRKPDTAWNDHPGCKDRLPTSEVAKSVLFTSKRIKPKDSASQPITPASFDIPQHSTMPGFPILEDLPRTVAKTVHVGNATVPSAQEEQQHYYVHRLLSRSSFDSLLTAVNVVSQIDAPKPQGQTASTAVHLNAQVAATESYDQHAPFIPFVPLRNSFDPRYVCPVAPTAPETNSPSIREVSPPSLSVPSLQLGSSEQQPVLLSDVKDSYADAAFPQPLKSYGPLPSGCARKNRKV
jgi:hypothetical protein